VPGCPIHRALCDRWDEYRQPSHNAFAVAVLVVIPEGDLLLLFSLLLSLSLLSF
jgi:hypothetical protein